MTANPLPPEPDGPTEKYRAEQALAEAERAVHLVQTHQPGAQLAFLRSWLSVLRGYADDTDEGERRRLAWDRCEVAEGKLEDIRAIVGGSLSPLGLAVLEVLER